MSSGSRRDKKRREEAPMPAASAGLLRFFEEDTPGVKISPYLVMTIGAGLVGVVLLAKALQIAGILPTT